LSFNGPNDSLAWANLLGRVTGSNLSKVFIVYSAHEPYLISGKSVCPSFYFYIFGFNYEIGISFT